MAERPAAYRLLDFVKSSALPCWAEGGICSQHGGAFEQLDLQGAPFADMPRRVRVQSRQIYVYAHAHHLGWIDGRQTVENCLSYMRRGALGDARLGERAGCAHTVTPDGVVIDPRRDLYDQAFLLLGMAWAWKAFGIEDCLQYIDQTWALIDSEMAASNGGWVEAIDTEIASPRRRQNPHMHLFEACMELAHCLEDRIWIERAAKIRVLFDQYFLDHETGGVIEFFDTKWRPEKAASARIIEPGHVAEWSWLLFRYGELTGRDESGFSRELLKTAETLGLNSDTGLLFDKVGSRGRGGRTHRTWPQTEYIRALVAAGLRGEEIGDRLENAVSAFMSHFVPDPEAGLWIDQVDHAGTEIFNRAPASTFYHILGAAVALDRLL